MVNEARCRRKRKPTLKYVKWIREFLLKNPEKTFKLKHLAYLYDDDIRECDGRDTHAIFSGIFAMLSQVGAITIIYKSHRNRRYIKNEKTIKMLDRYLSFKEMPIRIKNRGINVINNRSDRVPQLNFLGECKIVDAHFRELFEGEKK